MAKRQYFVAAAQLAESAAGGLICLRQIRVRDEP
jgi:hypothetical protein